MDCAREESREREPMRRFFVIGTAHLDRPDLFRAIEDALDRIEPDQLILEMPDAVVLRGEVERQKPEMVCAFRWAQRQGVPVRGHEPGEPSILRADLSPERIGELLKTLDQVVETLSVKATIDLFCARRPPTTAAEEDLASAIHELIDPEKAAERTRGVIEGVREVADLRGKIVIVCGGAHAARVVEALPGAALVRDDYFY